MPPLSKDPSSAPPPQPQEQVLQESLTPLGHAVSGAGGALLALAITYPLDIVKTRLQVATPASIHTAAAESDNAVAAGLKSKKHREKSPSRISTSSSSSSSSSQQQPTSALAAILEIMQKEGVAGLYAGLPAGLLGTASANFTYFYYYNWIRRWWQSNKYPTSTAIELALGAAAGALSQLTTIPVSVVITRQQTSSRETRQSFSDTWSTIVREEGVTGLWKGLKPSLVLVVNPAITYGMYERLKTWMGVDKGRVLKSWEVFVLGALAKTLATVVTYPYIMAKVRLQWKVPKELEHDPNLRYKGAVDVLRKVLKTDGLKGWYTGIQAQITKAVLSQALLLMLKDRLDTYTLILFMALRRLTAKSATA
ncbi:hypothetical protein RI367_000172 [Sorochytrium milnesiophthora]